MKISIKELRKIILEELKKSLKEQDLGAVDKLQTFIIKDERIYNNMLKPLEKKLILKVKDDNYDHQKAVKLFMYVTNYAAEKYLRQFKYGPKRSVDSLFDKATRLQVAEELAANFEDDMKYGKYKSFFKEENIEEKI